MDDVILLTDAEVFGCSRAHNYPHRLSVMQRKKIGTKTSICIILLSTYYYTTMLAGCIRSAFRAYLHLTPSATRSYGAKTTNSFM